MRTSLLLIAAALTLSTSVHAQFTDGQSADVYLGQTANNSNVTGGGGGGLSAPLAVAVDVSNGKLYVADGSSAARILRFSLGAISQFGSSAEVAFGQTSVDGTDGVGIGPNKLNNPYDLAVDGAGRLWVADLSNNRVLRFDAAYSKSDGANADGVLGQTEFTKDSSAILGILSSTMSGPSGVALDGSGNLYVADQFNNRVLRFNNAANKSNGAQADGVYGQADFTHNTSASVAANTLHTPTSVAVTASGTLYVVDQTNNRVLRFANAANASNGAGADGVIGQVDFLTGSLGSISSSTLKAPSNVTVDGAGRLYISDQGYNRVLRFNNASSITTGTNAADGVLGQSGFFTSSGNVGPAKLHAPAGEAIDNPNGKLWVVDNFNNRVLRYTSSIVPLPVELTSFTASARNGKVELAWATATEVNNYGFEVEKAIHSGLNGLMEWEKIAFVEGHGTTNAPQSYSFTDAAARVGKCSYRLKQIDRDGKFEYHQAVEVTIGVTPNTVWLDNNYPNPFNPSTQISFVLGTTGSASLKVFDLLGQEVTTLANGVFNAGDVQTFTFDASKYSSGIYYYQLKSGDRTEMKKMLLLK